MHVDDEEERSVGLAEELRAVFGELLELSDEEYCFECVDELDLILEKLDALRLSLCKFRKHCIARECCKGPDFCQIYIKQEEGSLTD